MRHATSLALLCLLSIGGCAVRSADERRSASSAIDCIDGRDEFLQACAACHGADARGSGPAAPALKTPPPDLTALAGRTGGTFPREHIIAVLSGEIEVTAHGSREMPIWSQRFGPGNVGATAAASIYARRWLEAVASHLESIQRPSSRAGEPRS